MIDLRIGDCLELVKDIPDKSVDLLLTDPPYLHVKGGCKSKGLNKGVRDTKSKVVSNMSDFGEKEINEFLDIVKPKMKIFNAYIFCSKLQIPYYLNWALKNKCQFDVLIWDKDFTGIISRKFFAPNIEYIIRIYKKGLNQLDESKYYQKIKQYKRPKNKVHETEKPVELLKEFIMLSSNNENIILDMFMGSGTSGQAVLEVGNRKFIGIEKDEKHFSIAKKRIEKTLEEMNNDRFKNW